MKVARIGVFELDVEAGELRRSGRLPRRGFRFIASVEWPVGGRVPHNGSSVARIDRRIAAVAMLFVIAAAFAWRVNRSQPAPVAIAVFAVDVDARTPELQPVSLALTDTLIGALVNEAGARARVASPLATRELASKPLDASFQSGIDYVVFVTLRSLAGRVLVHLKLVDRTGFVRWTSDRVLPLEELQREQLAMAGESSRQVVRAIFGGGLISSSN